MFDRRKTTSVLVITVLAGIAATVPTFMQTFRADELPRSASDPAAQSSWDAVAVGRVEPLSREIRAVASVPGRIAEVRVKVNDEVFADELLVRLDDDEALARLAAADAQVALRKRARNDQSASSGSAERRKAEDAAADAERAVADARAEMDRIAAEWRAGNAARSSVDEARANLSRLQKQLREKQEALSKLQNVLPSRLEGELNVARAEWTLAQAALEKTRIRAPIDGTVLQIDARKGELAVPSPESSLLVLGDVSGLRVRAEIDEQYRGKVHVGQRVLVRAAAFRDRAFEGKVASVGRMIGPGRINARGPRKLNDVDVLEVLVDLANPGPLVAGEQVDVYFVSAWNSPSR